MPSQTKRRNVGWKTSTFFLFNVYKRFLIFVTFFTFFNVFYFFFLERFLHLCTKRSDFHLGESHRVLVALPVLPLDAIPLRRFIVAAAVVETVQVWISTPAEPPGTFTCNCTRAACPQVVVLVSSAELMCKLPSQWITFTQQIEHWHVSLNSTVYLFTYWNYCAGLNTYLKTYTDE